MDRYSIILKKTPPPAAPSPEPAQPENILSQIKKTILAGKFPYKVEDAVIRFNREDPNWIVADVFIRPIYPVHHVMLNFIFTGPDEDYYHPTLGSNLQLPNREVQEAVLNRLRNVPSFYDISLITPPDDPSQPSSENYTPRIERNGNE